MTVHHENTGACAKCVEIFATYPEFYAPLQAWFVALQAQHPEVHISCAGRGQVDQEVCFERGASRAHWLQSSHNFNAAIDTFVLSGGVATWPTPWYDNVIAPAIVGTPFSWYGAPGASFFELPHIEATDWKALAVAGTLQPVEQPPKETTS